MAEKGLSYTISLIDRVSKPIKGIMQTVDSLNRGFLAVTGVGAAFAGTTAAITHFVDENLDALDAIHQLRNVTGETVPYIYELGKVAEVNGSSADAAQKSIEGLSKVIGEAAVGAGRGAKAFKQYGLSAHDANGVKSASKVMDELMIKMQTMSEQEQIAMLSKLGIDSTMIQTLRLGNQELDNARKYANALTLGVGTSESAEIAANFKDAMTRLGQVLKGVREYISVRLAPTIQGAIELFEKWFVANNDLIKKGLDNAVRVLGKFLSSTFAFFNAIDRVITSTIGWENALYGLIGMLGLVKSATIAAFIANPITWVAGAIVGLVLVLDDLFVFLKGGKSYFGEYWQKMFDILKNNKAEIALVAGLITGVLTNAIIYSSTKFVTMGAQVLQTVTKLGGLVNIIKIVGVAIKAAFASNPIGLAIMAISTFAYLVYTNWNNIKKAVGAAFEFISQKLYQFYNYGINIKTAFVQSIISAFVSLRAGISVGIEFISQKLHQFYNYGINIKTAFVQSIISAFMSLRAGISVGIEFISQKLHQFYDYAMNTAFVQGIISAFASLHAGIGVGIEFISQKLHQFYDYAMNTAFIQGIISAFVSLRDNIGSAWDWLTNKALDFINGLITMLNKLPAVNIDLIQTGSIPRAPSTPQVIGDQPNTINAPLATGGTIGTATTGALDLNPNKTIVERGKTVSNSVRATSNVQININAKTDAKPQDIAREVSKAIKENEFKQREQRELLA